jgi:hypothetical protein
MFIMAQKFGFVNGFAIDYRDTKADYSDILGCMAQWGQTFPKNRRKGKYLKSKIPKYLNRTNWIESRNDR